MNNHDNILNKVLYNDKGNLKAKYNRSKYKYPNITNYLKNRFNDSESIRETIDRIKFKIYERPVCKYCGGEVEYLGTNKFREFCCLSCKTLGTKDRVEKTCIKRYGVANFTNRLKYEQTCLNRYGVDNPNKSKIIREKTKQTCIKKYGRAVSIDYKKAKQTKFMLYGDENYNNRNKFKETSISRYGLNNPAKNHTIKEKAKQTCLKKYGCVSPMQNINVLNKSKNTALLHYGVENPIISKIVQDKILNTKRKNRTFNTSKSEEELYLYIKKKFPIVKRQYKCDRYPWCCDFYIPELDCFIEYNGFQAHGTHPYNPNSIKDQNIVELWTQRYNNGEHPLYKRMIEGWTISDVKKRNMAKENNLNYHEFWNLNKAKKFIDNL